jgi:DtxR family transcriptional regulator, Mn-dependent transcriptional regulator
VAPRIHRTHGPYTTESVDDYLKAILELGGSKEERVTSNALAQHLGIRAASVTGMLQKLAAQKPPFVRYEKHHGVRLTGSGKMRALEVLRHHRLLERFLHDFLDYSWDEVHDEAERLEHFISERLEDRIAAKLGDPETDPHGHPIPERSGALPPREEMSLSRWARGVPAVISSVSDRDPAALREMMRLGLKPGVAITVETGTRNASLRVRIGDRSDSVRLSETLASGVSVLAGPIVASVRRTIWDSSTSLRSNRELLPPNQPSGPPAGPKPMRERNTPKRSSPQMDV